MVKNLGLTEKVQRGQEKVVEATMLVCVGEMVKCSRCHHLVVLAEQYCMHIVSRRRWEELCFKPELLADN